MLFQKKRKEKKNPTSAVNSSQFNYFHCSQAVYRNEAGGSPMNFSMSQNRVKIINWSL